MRRAIVQDVADVVSMRAWALRVLAGAGASAEPPASAWDRFLANEPCAGPLAAALARHGRPVPAPVAAAARRDAERALRAEWDARRLGVLAAGLGVRMVLLKGGVPTVRGGVPPLRLADLDVLVRCEDVPTVEAALVADGYLLDEQRMAHHASFDALDGAHCIELHWSLGPRDGPPGEDVWTRARPLPGVAGLEQLSPADHLVHVTRHAMLTHAGRAVSLRDLVVIADAVVRCDQAERDAALAALTAGPHAAPLSDAVRAATQLAAAETVDDPSAGHAVEYYLAHEIGASGWRGEPPHPSWRFVALAAGRMTLREAIVTEGSRFAALPAATLLLRRRWPRIAPRALRALQAAYHLSGFVTGPPLILGLRRRVRRRLRAV